MKKIIFILILFLSCYIIYNLTVDSKYYYLSIGDYLSYGVNSYGLKENGYSFYVKNYLEREDELKYFNDSFTDNNYRIIDLINMVKYNEEKVINGKKLNINQLLKKADIITLSAGMNDLYYKLNVNDDNIYNYMNGLISDMDELLNYIDRFNHNKVFVLGYYNVGVEQEYINYINVKLKYIVEKRNFIYIDLSNIFDNNPIYFNKKGVFVPNNEGYLKISKIIVDNLENY